MQSSTKSIKYFKYFTVKRSIFSVLSLKFLAQTPRYTILQKVFYISLFLEIALVLILHKK